MEQCIVWVIDFQRFWDLQSHEKTKKRMVCQFLKVTLKCWNSIPYKYRYINKYIYIYVDI